VWVQRVLGGCGQGQNVNPESVEELEPVHPLALLTYPRPSGRWLGHLISCGTALVMHGLRRVLGG